MPYKQRLKTPAKNPRKRKTYKVTNWTEYNKILMSLHIFEFIDDPILRRCERIALNRGEAYHQLTGKIGSVNGNKFQGTTELEFQIANECCRFVANCVIYYNTLILSKIYEIQEKLGNTAALEFIKRLSPVAWRHINMNGRLEFSNSGNVMINIDEMVANLVFKHKKN